MSESHSKAAERLRSAYAGPPISPLRDLLAATDVNGAYAVQSINTQKWLAEGRRIIGRKIGLTAEAVQRQFGIDQPDYGVLFHDMLIANGADVSPARLLQPRVEGEVALVLGKDLDRPDANALDLLRATDYALPAIEIVDSRITDWKITIADTIADNASSALFVLGSMPRLLAGLDLRTCGMVMEADGKILSSGVGAACLGHPLNSAAWLASTLARRGDPLRAGDVVMTGALGPMASIKPGMRISVSIGGLGDVAFYYRDTAA